MKSTTRRTFIRHTALAAGAAVLTTSFKTNNTMEDKTFIHHVYFWLKNAGSAEDTEKLIAGLKKIIQSKINRFFSYWQTGGHQPRSD